MSQEARLVCSNCEVTKQTYNDELLLLRTSFVEYKKRVICTDKLFKQLTAKRAQVTKVEGKLIEANNTLSEVQEQFKSTFVNHKLTAEKCNGLELELAKVTAERDKELCDLLNIQQQKAALEDQIKTISQKHQKIQEASAEKIKKLEAKLKVSDKKTLEKLTAKFEAQGLELTLLKQELEDQHSDCETLRRELKESKSNIDETFKDKLKQQETELSSLREEMLEKHAEINSLKETLEKANQANKQVKSLIDKLGSQETECLLLRNMIMDQHAEIEQLKQNAVCQAEKSIVQLKYQEHEIIVLRQKLKEQIDNSLKREDRVTKTEKDNTEVSVSDQDCQRTMLDTELQNLRYQIGVMKLEFERNDAGKLTIQLADKESELVLLRNELETQRLALEDTKLKLRDSEREATLQIKKQFPENSGSTAFSTEENLSSAEEIAELKLQLSKLQSDMDLKTKDMVQIQATNATECTLEHFPGGTAAAVLANDPSILHDEEIISLKLQMSGLKTEVDLKTEEIEKLKNANKIPCKCDLCPEGIGETLGISTANNNKVHNDEISSLKLQLSSLQIEVDLRTKEMEQMREEESLNARKQEDLKEKSQLAEARTFELVAELAQLKSRDEGTNSVLHKCSQLEKVLALRDTQITQLKTELKGLLAGQREPRKPSGAHSASSGRGSCNTPDLDDSETLVDVDATSEPDASNDVDTILRLMTAVPAMLLPIDAVMQPVTRTGSFPSAPLPSSAPDRIQAAAFNPPPERTMQEKMLLALVESVRSATESYEKLYGSRPAAPPPPQPLFPDVSCDLRKSVCSAGSSFKVVDEWIKNVSPEIGADQRSFSDGFGSASSSKGSVQEVNVERRPAMPERRVGLDRSGGKPREMSASFSGRRASGRNTITIVPSEDVTLSKRLSGVTLKSNLKIGSELRSFSDGFSSGPEVAMEWKKTMPDGKPREMATAFSGRRAPGSAAITMVPSEVVALSRRLKSGPLKSSLHETGLDCVRKSVAKANKADLFVLGKAPTMATLCSNMNVNAPSKFEASSVAYDSNSSNTNKRTTRSQVLNNTTGVCGVATVRARKEPIRTKIPPISESFVRVMSALNPNPPTILNCAKDNTIEAETATNATKILCSGAVTATTASKSESVVPKAGKKRKAKVDILFGSDDELHSPTKKQFSDNSSALNSDDEVSTSLVVIGDMAPSTILGSKHKLPHVTLLDGTERQSCKVRVTGQSTLDKGTHPKDPPASKSVSSSDEINTSLVEVQLSKDISVDDDLDYEIPKTTAPVPKVENDARGIVSSDPKPDCEIVTPNPEDDNNAKSKINLPNERIGSSTLDSKVEDSSCEIKMEDLEVEPILAVDSDAKHEVSETERTDASDLNGSSGLSKGDCTALDSNIGEMVSSKTNSVSTVTGDAVDSREKSNPAQQLEDDDLSDCELVIADAVEPLNCSAQINLTDVDESSDEEDKAPRVTISVQTDPIIRDNSSEYDSDDEPLSSLLSSPSRTNLRASLQMSPGECSETTPKVEHISNPVPICIAPPTELKRPFFYKPLEEVEDVCPPVTLDLGDSSEREQNVEVVPQEPSRPPPPKLRDETGVWSRRVYATLAHNATFFVRPEAQNEKDVRDKEVPLMRYLRIVIPRFLSDRVPLEEALETSVKNLKGVSETCIVNEVMAQVTMDRCKPEKKVANELQTTPRVQRLIALFATLHVTNPTLAEQMLTQIEKRVCHLSAKPSMDILKRLISLHLGICLRLGMSERMRTLLFDVLYCYAGRAMEPVCLHILTSAPFALKHGFMGQDDMVSLTTAYALQFGKFEWAHEHKTLPQLVSEQYKYNKERLPSAAQLVERMVHMLKAGDTDFVEACLVLLAKRLGWTSASKLIVGPMRRVVERWQFGGMPFASAVVALRVIAFIVRTVPKDDELADTLFDRVSALLKCDKKEIHECVLTVLMMMGREKHVSTVTALLKSHGETSSEEFSAAATAYIAKQGNGMLKPRRKPRLGKTTNKDMPEADAEGESSAKASPKPRTKNAKKNWAKKRRREAGRQKQK